MTVASPSNKITFAGNGSTTNFPFTFSVPSATPTDIAVYYTDALGNITLLASTSYTLTINAAVSPNPTSVGGTVIYNPNSVPIPPGTSLTILRTLPLTQPVSFVNQGALYTSVVEQGEDALTMMVQQLSELLGRQITVAVSDPTPTTLPTAAQRANLAMMFDSAGNPIAAAPGGANSPISSAMAPVVNASTIAAAVALLGLTGVTAIPTGVMTPWLASSSITPPSGWLLCGGQAVSRTGANAALFARIGTVFGAGDGSTTFNLPDMRGRVAAGLDDINGVAASRLTATSIPNGGGPTSLGGNGGAETHTLTATEMAVLTFTTVLTTATNIVKSIATVGLNAIGGGSSEGFNSGTSSGGNTVTAATTSNAGGNPHVIVQPTICVNWIVKL